MIVATCHIFEWVMLILTYDQSTVPEMHITLSFSISALDGKSQSFTFMIADEAINLKTLRESLEGYFTFTVHQKVLRTSRFPPVLIRITF